MNSNANKILDIIMDKSRIDNILLSEMTNIHPSTICRYRSCQRNIGKKNFIKIYNALIELEVRKKALKELKQGYENSRDEKIL